MRILLLGTTAIYAGLTAQPLGSQTWTNGDGTALWGDAGNWDGGTVPDDASSGVIFDDPGADSAVGLTDTGGTQDTFTVNSLDIQTGTQLSGGTLVLDGVDPTVNVAATATGSAFASDMSLRLRANAVFTMLADFVSEATITAEGDQLLEVNAGAGTTTRLAGALEETGGALGVEVSGGGTVVMEAENTYTGATDVTSGTLSVTGSGTLASTDVNVDAGGMLTTDGGALAAGTELENAGTVTLGGSETIARLNGSGTTAVTSGTLTLTSGESEVDGAISGAGGLTVNDTGQAEDAAVTLTAENSYTGATDVTSGTLSVTGSGTLASTDVNVASGGTLTTDGGALAAGTALVNAGEVTLGGSETIARLNGSGTTAVTSGTLTLTSGESEVDGAISGAGGLTVNDTGQAEDAAVTLTAENSYTGATDVTSGELSVTGSIASSVVTVGVDGKLDFDSATQSTIGALDNASAAADKGVNLAANTHVTVSTTAGSGELKNSGTISLGTGATLEAETIDNEDGGSISLGGNAT
ncbi:beta strand repeat-containing protein, partial [Tritonibacter mobilis]|uniref:beta strand repeat-containing protein n=1 Tax=Tritonibacter mobilis TaxID=379347 RepID=UPI001952909B